MYEIWSHSNCNLEVITIKCFQQETNNLCVHVQVHKLSSSTNLNKCVLDGVSLLVDETKYAEVT